MSAASTHVPGSTAAADGSLGGSGAAIEVVAPDDLLGIGRGADILVVDDNSGNRTAYEAALAPLGRNVVLVASGMEALAKLLDQDFALILLDVEMPGMSGIETARMIRASPRRKGTPIIFITGRAWQDDVIAEAYALGAFDFVTKPILPEILRAKARLYLQLQERTLHLEERAAELRAAHARLARETQEHARTHAADVATARRLEKLQEATAALGEATTTGDIATVVVRLGAEAVSATSAVLWLLEHDGALTCAGSYRVPEAYLARWFRIESDASAPAVRVVQRREPVWVENADDYAREAPDIVDHARAADRLWAYAALPLCRGEQPIGVVSFSYEGTHTFSPEERRFLGALVRSCEQALERARLFDAEASARKRAEAASLRKDELLAMLGHELRNPLATMTAAIDMIEIRDGLTRELTLLDRQVTHLSRLVEDLVDASRVTQGMISLRRTQVALGDALQVALDYVRPLVERRQHQLSISIPPDLVLDADPDRLAQILGNVLVNAATYTPERGHIEVVARTDEAHVLLEVRDNGIGIGAELLPQVFDIFV